MILYRLLVSVFALLVLARALVKRDGSAGARLGFGVTEPGPHIWLHAASNGELASARPVIEALRIQRPDLPLLVTCNSATGVTLAKSWGLAAIPAPLDLGWVARRVHRRWDVRAHVTMESELWPHRVLGCRGPAIVLGGRLTEGTARGWRLFGGLQARVLRRVAFLSAQDEGSAQRFRAAGLPGAALGPVVDLKALYAPAEMHDPRLGAAFARGTTWLAASTHEGEERVVLDAHVRARAHEPALRLILAPRHPRRAAAIVQEIAAHGLSHAQRSRGDAPEGAEVYLADTMGEMPLFYALAGRVFIGGTLLDKGGHTPYEPAHFGAALIHGPDVAKQADAFARLAAARASTEIHDAAQLAAALEVLAPEELQARQGAAARAALTPAADAGALVAEFTRHLDGIA